MDSQKIYGLFQFDKFTGLHDSTVPHLPRPPLGLGPQNLNRSGPPMMNFQPQRMASDDAITPDFQKLPRLFRMKKLPPKDPVLFYLALENIWKAPSVKKALPSLGVRGRRSGGDPGIYQGFPNADQVQGQHLRLETRMMSA